MKTTFRNQKQVNDLYYHNLIYLFTLLTALFVLAVPTFAKDVYIKCPLESAQTKVTSLLPNGWWQTPQVGRLEGVRTQVIGGDPTLVCLYKAYSDTVAVMHLYPTGMDCWPEGDGFRCSSNGSKSPAHGDYQKKSGYEKSKTYSKKKAESKYDKKDYQKKSEYDKSKTYSGKKSEPADGRKYYQKVIDSLLDQKTKE